MEPIFDSIISNALQAYDKEQTFSNEEDVIDAFKVNVFVFEFFNTFSYTITLVIESFIFFELIVVIMKIKWEQPFSASELLGMFTNNSEITQGLFAKERKIYIMFWVWNIIVIIFPNFVYLLFKNSEESLDESKQGIQNLIGTF